MEYGPGGQPASFGPAEQVIIARKLSEVVEALARLDDARAAGAWVAGWIAYEAGAAFEPRLSDVWRGEEPLLVFGVFPNGPQEASSKAADLAVLTHPEPLLSWDKYRQAVGRVLNYIARGDCYQVNLTFPLRARLLGDPLDLFLRLREAHPVGHAAFVDLGVGPVVVSLSPELFVRVSGRIIETRPMKGTAPRSADPVQDAALAAELRGSEKARAENLMIVDLLRNDLSRVARAGSVKVPALFAIESYVTMHQMTSTIIGELSEPASLSTLMPALFP